MTEYGVIPTGFNRKPLAVILAEMEAKNQTEYGPDVIQTSQSPLGQINGLIADFTAQLWELAEDVYQSYDVTQAEDSRLDALAKLRLMRRGVGESETQFRQAITNQGQARIDLQDIVRALRSIEGVTYAQVFLNETQENDGDENRVPVGFISAAVLGGDEADIAGVLRQYVVPGISTYGNTYVSTLVDGFCRAMAIMRPTLVPITLTAQVRTRNDATGCPPPSLFAIEAALVTALNSTFINGDDVNHFRIRSIVESQFSNVEVVSITAAREGDPASATVQIGFDELATFSVDDTTLTTI